jgi:beta-glucosidase
VEGADNLADYLNAALPSERRAELLLARMSLDDKIGQMCQYVGETSSPTAENADEVVGYALALSDKIELIRSGRVGSFLKVPGALEANYLQQVAAATPLGIPLLIGTDAIHGHGMDLAAATIFPSPISFASAFDPDLARRIAVCTAREMRATGFHWSFSPNVDVVRDSRWGRTGETFGEDPCLVAELGVAMVQGYQGDDFSGAHEVLACAKHLVAGGIPNNGLNGAPSELSERTLHELYYPPFARTIEAGAFTLMPSHNEVNGVPCHADADLLTRRLRQEWGFRGFVISDWLDVERLRSVHHIAETRADADRLGVLAGIDMHMHGGEFFESVRAQVQEGLIPLARIDAAVRPILRAKFQLGLFERRYIDPQAINEIVCCEEHLELALEAARKSIVLLKNDGVLPLEVSAARGVRRVLVTGPDAADQSILGDWARVQPEASVISIEAGLRRQAPAGVEIEHVATGPIGAISDSQIEAALEAAKHSDVLVLALGENSLRFNPARTSGENVDRVSLEPPGRQLELMRALVGAGKPIVVVLINGAPIASEWLVAHAAAVVEAWEPGMMGGAAIAEVLFGTYNPSGRLPMTVPRSVGHLGAVYDHRPSAHHRGRLRFSESDPLFRFGHGLSYSRFEYQNVRCAESFGVGQELVVEVDVRNAGERSGDDIVLLFLRDVYASVTRPVRQLKAFQRVSLEPGESASVRFVLPPAAFTLLDRDLKRVAEPGEFRLYVGLDGPEKSVWLKA